MENAAVQFFLYSIIVLKNYMSGRPAEQWRHCDYRCVCANLCCTLFMWRQRTSRANPYARL